MCSMRAHGNTLKTRVRNGANSVRAEFCNDAHVEFCPLWHVYEYVCSVLSTSTNNDPLAMADGRFVRRSVWCVVRSRKPTLTLTLVWCIYTYTILYIRYIMYRSKRILLIYAACRIARTTTPRTRTVSLNSTPFTPITKFRRTTIVVYGIWHVLACVQWSSNTRILPGPGEFSTRFHGQPSKARTVSVFPAVGKCSGSRNHNAYDVCYHYHVWHVSVRSMCRSLWCPSCGMDTLPNES